ncbi:MAG: hypothetical protein DDT27_01266 [Dehalococcoidia bacterium]|nr:hypothetical protein [Chloroflexota bacterium]
MRYLLSHLRIERLEDIRGDQVIGIEPVYLVITILPATHHPEARFLALKDKPNLGIEAGPEVIHRPGDLLVAVHFVGKCNLRAFYWCGVKSSHLNQALDLGRLRYWCYFHFLVHVLLDQSHPHRGRCDHPRDDEGQGHHQKDG